MMTILSWNTYQKYEYFHYQTPFLVVDITQATDTLPHGIQGIGTAPLNFAMFISCLFKYTLAALMLLIECVAYTHQTLFCGHISFSIDR